MLLLARALDAQTCAAPPKGLAAWLTADEPFLDASLRAPGFVGRTLRFDGNRKFAELPSGKEWKVGEGDFSIELWMRTSDSVRIRNLVDARNSAPRGYLVYIHHGTVAFQVAAYPQITDAHAAAYPIADGRWHHVVAVAKRLPPQAPILYVDGVKRIQSGRNVPLGNLDHDTPVWLARHHSNELVPRDNIYYNGDMDEISVYRRALAPDEIAALFKAGRAGKCRK